MPEIDGLDILRYVRSNAQLADLPVISEWQPAGPLQDRLQQHQHCRDAGSVQRHSNRYSHHLQQQQHICSMLLMACKASCCPAT